MFLLLITCARIYIYMHICRCIIDATKQRPIRSTKQTKLTELRTMECPRQLSYMEEIPLVKVNML